MRAYEIMLVNRPNLDEEAYEALLNKVKGIIETNGGTVDKVDKWGKRRLAYEIKDLFEGYYVLIRFTGDSRLSKELDRLV